MAQDKEAPENVSLLSKCPLEKIEKFCHGLIDGLLGRTRLRYKNYDQVWTLEEWFDVLDACQHCVKKISRKQVSQEQISLLFDGLSDDITQAFVSCVNVRSAELRQHLLEQVTSISHSHLQDFDWKLKLALSSDKISSVQEPLLSVDFNIKTGDEVETVSIEMNKEELKTFINSLESANKVMVQMKT